jgi:hypothetical protein
MNKSRRYKLDMLSYFWEEKGNMERWVHFNREDMKKDFPELLKVWDDYNAAKRMIDLVIAGLKAEFEPDSDE